MGGLSSGDFGRLSDASWSWNPGYIIDWPKDWRDEGNKSPTTAMTGTGDQFLPGYGTSAGHGTTGGQGPQESFGDWVKRVILGVTIGQRGGNNPSNVQRPVKSTGTTVPGIGGDIDIPDGDTNVSNGAEQEGSGLDVFFDFLKDIAPSLITGWGAANQTAAVQDAAEQAAAAAQMPPTNITTPFGRGAFKDGEGVAGFSPDVAKLFQNMLGQATSATDQPWGAQGFSDPFQRFAYGAQKDIPGAFADVQGMDVGYWPEGSEGLYQRNRRDVEGVRGGALGQFADLSGARASGDYDALREENLGLLRESARPGQERAVNKQLNKLFSGGRLGTTGGASQMRGLAEAQEAEDLQFQLASTGLARDQMALEEEIASGQRQQGMGFGRLAGEAAGMASNLDESIVNRHRQLDLDRYGRSTNRLGNLMSMFGQGQDLRDQDFNRGTLAIQNLMGLSGGLRDTLALGGNLSGQHASAGYGAGQLAMRGAGDPFGAFLQALGMGMNT